MDNYECLGIIGQGTYGVVIKARHKYTGQIVAIKKFKESDEDDQVRKTALREIRVLKQLKHDNIVTLLEVFRKNGKLYLVFEYVERTILEELEKNPNGLDKLEVKKIFWQLLTALHFIHSHNIVHRDIKPENLLLSKNGVLKLCDFGFARAVTRPGSKYTNYVATRWYRAPELLVGDTDYGKWVDIWASGCMFAEILNGLPLFPGESDLDQLAHIMKCLGKLTPHFCELFTKNPAYVGVKLPTVKVVEPLAKKFPSLDRAALSVMKKCLRYEPEERETCAQLLQHQYFQGFADWFQNELSTAIQRDKDDLETQKQAWQRMLKQHKPGPAPSLDDNKFTSPEPMEDDDYPEADNKKIDLHEMMDSVPGLDSQRRGSVPASISTSIDDDNAAYLQDTLDGSTELSGVMDVTSLDDNTASLTSRKKKNSTSSTNNNSSSMSTNTKTKEKTALSPKQGGTHSIASPYITSTTSPKSTNTRMKEFVFTSNDNNTKREGKKEKEKEKKSGKVPVGSMLPTLRPVTPRSNKVDVVEEAPEEDDRETFSSHQKRTFYPQIKGQAYQLNNKSDWNGGAFPKVDESKGKSKHNQGKAKKVNGPGTPILPQFSISSSNNQPSSPSSTLRRSQGYDINTWKQARQGLSDRAPAGSYTPSSHHASQYGAASPYAAAQNPFNSSQSISSFAGNMMGELGSYKKGQNGQTQGPKNTMKLSSLFSSTKGGSVFKGATTRQQAFAYGDR